MNKKSKMILDLSKIELKKFVEKLLHNFSPEGIRINIPLAFINNTLERCDYCFSKINTKYFKKNSNSYFNISHSDQMAMFLWFLSNTIYKKTKEHYLPSKLSYLNKIMHGIDLFYFVEMPNIFLLVHPLGTVLGRGGYKDYFVAYQNCTVGSKNGVYPEFEEGVILYSKSSVIGKCKIKKNVIFAANSSVIDQNIEKNTVVTGHYPKNIFKQNHKNVKLIFSKGMF